MSVSIFLGGFGFGNLGDEACLATSYRLYKSEINCAFSYDELITSKAGHFDYYFRDIESVFAHYPKINRVVIAGGGVGFIPSFKDNLDWALRCKERGADVIVHNVGIGKIGREWASSWPYLVPVLSEAKEFSVRDYRSKSEVQSWGLSLSPTISFYPERNLDIDRKFENRFSQDSRYLGISVNNRPALWTVLHDNEAVLHEVLAKFHAHKILPIISTIHALDEAEHDNTGFNKFADQFHLKDRVVFEELCDYQFWRENVGPADIKFLISKCQFLLSARKHNIIHSIGSSIPFLGIFEFDNDSIPRLYQTLYRFIPENSSLLPLYPL